MVLPIAVWLPTIQGLIDIIFCGVKKALCWCIGWLLDWLNPLIEYLLKKLPTPPTLNLEFMNGFWGTLNLWLPMDLMINTFVSYGAWLVAFLVLRTIKRFIPFIS